MPVLWAGAIVLLSLVLSVPVALAGLVLWAGAIVLLALVLSVPVALAGLVLWAGAIVLLALVLAVPVALAVPVLWAGAIVLLSVVLAGASVFLPVELVVLVVFLAAVLALKCLLVVLPTGEKPPLHLPRSCWQHRLHRSRIRVSSLLHQPTLECRARLAETVELSQVCVADVAPHLLSALVAHLLLHVCARCLLGLPVLVGHPPAAVHLFPRCSGRPE